MICSLSHADVSLEKQVKDGMEMQIPQNLGLTRQQHTAIILANDEE